MKKFDLIALAQILELLSGGALKLHREEKRRIPTIVQWMDRNWAAIAPLLSQIQIYDEDNPSS